LIRVYHDAYSCITAAHAVAVITEWEEFTRLDWQKIYNKMQKPAFVFDGRNILDGKKINAIGFEYSGIGK
jgi:UDPglucose 6-dehydrogenase